MRIIGTYRSAGQASDAMFACVQEARRIKMHHQASRFDAWSNADGERHIVTVNGCDLGRDLEYWMGVASKATYEVVSCVPLGNRKGQFETYFVELKLGREDAVSKTTTVYAQNGSAARNAALAEC